MALSPCPECNREISDKAEFCPHCGYKLIPEKRPERNLISCPNCKRNITITSEKCGYCGYRLRNENVTYDDNYEKSGFERFNDGLKGCADDSFKFGCGCTALTIIIGLLLALLFGLI